MLEPIVKRCTDKRTGIDAHHLRRLNREIEHAGTDRRRRFLSVKVACRDEAQTAAATGLSNCLCAPAALCRVPVGTSCQEFSASGLC